MQKTLLIGYLGKDPEMKYTPGKVLGVRISAQKGTSEFPRRPATDRAWKWYKKVSKWPCGPVSNCQGGLSCEKTGLFGKTKLRDGRYAWFAVVNCTCPPTGIPTESLGVVTAWIPAPQPPKQSKKSARAEMTKLLCRK